jgi:hypothetical protein
MKIFDLGDAYRVVDGSRFHILNKDSLKITVDELSNLILTDGKARVVVNPLFVDSPIIQAYQSFTTELDLSGLRILSETEDPESELGQSVAMLKSVGAQELRFSLLFYKTNTLAFQATSLSNSTFDITTTNDATIIIKNDNGSTISLNLPSVSNLSNFPEITIYKYPGSNDIELRIFSLEEGVGLAFVYDEDSNKIVSSGLSINSSSERLIKLKFDGTNWLVWNRITTILPAFE